MVVARPVLPLEASLQSPFMRGENRHICYHSGSNVDSAAALKCDVYGLKSLLAGYLVIGSVHWMGAQYVNVWESVHNFV